MTLEQLAKQGRRTATMTTAATISSKMSQIRKESIKQAFCDFENVKYRYEYIDVIDGVTYYDDSAACSTEAAWFSFDNMHQPVIWITYADNNDCEDEILKDKVVDCESLGKAVKMASMMADFGDCVMLSPATHINVDYRSYMDRGDDFKQYVYSLK